jgi:hypothetical protein
LVGTNHTQPIEQGFIYLSLTLSPGPEKKVGDSRQGVIRAQGEGYKRELWFRDTVDIKKREGQ